MKTQLEPVAKAAVRHIRISPRKARMVVNMIRGRGVEEALTILAITPKKASRFVTKLIRSALASARSASSVDVDRLVVSRIWVDAGPTWKRYKPRAMGRATRIRKRTSHINVELAEA